MGRLPTLWTKQISRIGLERSLVSHARCVWSPPVRARAGVVTQHAHPGGVRVCRACVCVCVFGGGVCGGGGVGALWCCGGVVVGCVLGVFGGVCVGGGLFWCVGGVWWWVCVGLCVCVSVCVPVCGCVGARVSVCVCVC